MTLNHLFRMKTFHNVVILEDRENMDPSSGNNNKYLFFYADAEEEFLFLPSHVFCFD
jgi:hypothetical protein